MEEAILIEIAQPKYRKSRPLLVQPKDRGLIPLTQGKVAVVDKESVELLNQWNWHAIKIKNTWYARSRDKETGKTIGMHHIVAGITGMIDHKDGNGLNNRRRNLRATDHRGNAFNTPVTKRNKLGIKGVCPASSGSGFRAHFGKRYLGTFHTSKEAHDAYRSAASAAGEFARCQ